MGYIESGKSDGATLVTGGAPPRDGALANGCYLAPAIFTGVERGMRIVREEIFGPVVTVMRFRDEAEAVSIANDSQYGLSGSISGRATAPARCGSPARSRAGTSRSTPVAACTSRPPSAA